MPTTSPSAEFVSLLTEHQADLWAFIITQLPGSPDVGDVLQKTNLTLWNKQSDFQPGTDFRAWALATARFEVLAHLKKHKRGNWLVFNDELLDTIATEAPETIPESSTRLNLLEQCLQKLRPNHRELLTHRYQSKEGLDVYSRQSGRSVSSLSVTLHRIRATLRKCINEGLSQTQQKGGQA